MHKTKRRRTRRAGLTLIEVLAVTAILVIMGTLVGLAVRQFSQQAKVNLAKTQIKLFRQGLDLYCQQVGSFPADLAALREPPADLAKPEKWQGPYLKEDIPLDPWDNDYQYELLGPESYRIWSTGPDAAADEDDLVEVESG